MNAKPVIPRTVAKQDVEDGINYYLHEGSQSAALGFIDALEQAYSLISHYPGAGSTRYASELDLPGIRSLPLKGYPYLVFYVEQINHIDVWRILHGMRDIPSWLRGAAQHGD